MLISVTGLTVGMVLDHLEASNLVICSSQSCSKIFVVSTNMEQFVSINITGSKVAKDIQDILLEVCTSALAL